MDDDETASSLKKSKSPELARHILPSAGAMIGICATMIGLVKILEGKSGETFADELGAVISLIFLVSAVFSYLAIRTAERARMSLLLERVADTSFLLALTSIAIVVVLWTFEKI